MHLRLQSRLIMMQGLDGGGCRKKCPLQNRRLNGDSHDRGDFQ